MVLDRIRERAEDHARFAQLCLERGSHGDAVKHRVHGHAGQQLLLVQRNAQLGIGAEDLRINFIQALQFGLLLGAE